MVSRLGTYIYTYRYYVQYTESFTIIIFIQVIRFVSNDRIYSVRVFVYTCTADTQNRTPKATFMTPYLIGWQRYLNLTLVTYIICIPKPIRTILSNDTMTKDATPFVTPEFQINESSCTRSQLRRSRWQHRCVSTEPAASHGTSNIRWGMSELLNTFLSFFYSISLSSLMSDEVYLATSAPLMRLKKPTST